MPAKLLFPERVHADQRDSEFSGGDPDRPIAIDDADPINIGYSATK